MSNRSVGVVTPQSQMRDGKRGEPNTVLNLVPARMIAVEYAVVSVLAGCAAVMLGLLAAGWRRAPVPDEGES